MDEQLKIFDSNKNELGTADRNIVHKQGYWHETFHCWFVEKINDTDYIYFQKRSPSKTDFPSLLDITAAGHLLSHENVADGTREVKEELGIDVHEKDLKYLGIVKDTIIMDHFIDREFAHVYLYRVK